MTLPAGPQEYAAHYLEAACNDCLNLDDPLRGEGRRELILEMYGHLREAHAGLDAMTFTVVSDARGGLRLTEIPIYRQRLTAEQSAVLERAALTPALSQNGRGGRTRTVRARPEGVTS